MNWAEPEWLKLLLAPGAVALLLIAMSITRRREGPVRWPGIRRVVAAGSRVFAVPPGRSARRPWLLLVACAVAIVALARPRWGEIERPVFQQAREVMLALDLSRSMLAQDVAPDRLSRARLLVASLLDGLRGERVGLIVFAGTAFVQVPLSADYQILNEFLPELNPAYMPQGGTDYAGMLRASTGGFSDAANTDRYLIILSDGEALDDTWRAELPGLEKLGVRVIALGVGTTAGGFIPDERTGFVKDERGAVVLSRLEPATLRSLAQQTDGVYRDASVWVDLAALLAETVERGRRGEFTEERSVDYVERFQWFLAPAVLIVALGLLREIGIRPRPRNVSSTHAKSAPALRRSREKKRSSATALVALVALSLSALIVNSGVLHAEEAALPPTPDALVRETVTRIAGAATPGAADWLELADRTLAYGAAAKQAGAPVASGPILDALLALDEGEKLDPVAADWTKLRSELEQLLEQPPPSEEEQKQDEQEQRDEQKDEQEQQEQDKDESGEGDDESQKQQGPQEPQSGEPESGKQDQQQPQNGGNEDQPAPDEGRMGDLEEEKQEDSDEQPSPPPPPKQTKKFGGKASEGALPPTSNPELAAAMRQLKEAQKNDSPAKLFELLEGEETDKKTTGKDW